MKIRFIRDYSPRKKGEVVEFKTKEDSRVAEHYISLGVAVDAEQKSKEPASSEGCEECKKKREIEVSELKETLALYEEENSNQKVVIQNLEKKVSDLEKSLKKS